MTWNRGTDYHGSRSYGVDAPGPGRFTRIVKRLTRYFSAETHPKPEALKTASSQAILRPNGERHFSLLGADRRSLGTADDCPFPLAANDTRNWRVLP